MLSILLSYALLKEEIDVDISDTFGATLLGSFFACILTGVSAIQVYYYYTFYPKDIFGTKLLVFIVWVLDCAHTAIIMASVYDFLISSRCNPSISSNGHWMMSVSLCLETAIACFVQAYFVSVVSRLSPVKIRWWITGPVGCIVLLHFTLGMETLLTMLFASEMNNPSSIKLSFVLPFVVFALLADISIAATLVYLLHGHRSGFQRTDTMVTKLIIFTLNRGVIITAFSIMECILLFKLPLSLWCLGMDYVLGKLYANSFLFSLNSRNLISNDNEPEGMSGSVHFSGLDATQKTKETKSLMETAPTAGPSVPTSGASSSGDSTSVARGSLQ